MYKSVALKILNAHIPTNDKSLFCDSCGIYIEDEYDNYLTDFQVICANGEEGFANIINWYCGDCLIEVTNLLTSIGFSNHHHGGINFLEDVECPGYHNKECLHN